MNLVPSLAFGSNFTIFFPLRLCDLEGLPFSPLWFHGIIEFQDVRRSYNGMIQFLLFYRGGNGGPWALDIWQQDQTSDYQIFGNRIKLFPTLEGWGWGRKWYKASRAFDPKWLSLFYTPIHSSTASNWCVCRDGNYCPRMLYTCQVIADGYGSLGRGGSGPRQQ